MDTALYTTETFTFHIAPSTSDARQRISDGAADPTLLRGTLAQGRELARLLDAPIDLLFGTGHTAFHIKRDGTMPCEEDECGGGVMRDEMDEDPRF